MSQKSCFVIMPLSDRDSSADNRWDDLYENYISPAVEKAGLGYSCYRSQDAQGSFMHDIVRHLVTDEVVIAVLTELRPNVMYELGARSALRGRTIMLIEESSQIPADLAAHIALRYSTRTTSSRQKLVKTIRDRLKRLDVEKPPSDNPVHDYLVLSAAMLVSEWFENENPNAFRPRLARMLPDYVLHLEHVWRKVGPSFGIPEKVPWTGLSSAPIAVAQAQRASMLLTNLGTELKDRHELNAALKHFDVALELDPDNLTALGNRALVLVMLRRDEEAAESSRTMETTAPRTADSWNALGKVLLAEKDFRESAHAFRHAFEIDGKSAIYANNAGFALELSGAEEEALGYYEKSLALNPGFAHALYNRGKLLRKLGREQEGVRSMDQALDGDPLIGEEIEAQRHAFLPDESAGPVR